jgi:hypothetical protein
MSVMREPSDPLMLNVLNAAKRIRRHNADLTANHLAQLAALPPGWTQVELSGRKQEEPLVPPPSYIDLCALRIGATSLVKR